MKRHAVVLVTVALGCGWAGSGADGGAPGRDGGGGESSEPGVVFLTVNELPEEMKGSRPFTALDGKPHDFRLALPPDGFTLDASVIEGDANRLSVTCDGAAGDRDAGAELADLFAEVPTGRRWRVAPGSGFAPATTVSCSATVADGEPSTVAFAVVAPTPTLLPFDDPETFVLDFTRDYFTVSPGADPGTGGYTIVSSDGANGIPDYLEEMTVLGLQGGESAAGADALTSSLAPGEVGVNAVLARRFRLALLARVRGFFHQAPDGARHEDSVPFDLMLDDDAGAPDLSTFSSTGSFSIMGIGGEGTVADRMVPYFGKAELDPRNEVRNDDSVYGLGVFTTTGIRAALANPLAQALVAPFVPDLGGTALGDADADPVFLADGFDPATADPAVAARAQTFTTLFDLLIKALGALTAHETAHSLGLVPDGPPPTGLFGGEARAEFALPLTTPGHLDVEGLNLMASGGGGAGLGGGASLLDEPFFTPLELAYFRGRLWVLPP